VPAPDPFAIPALRVAGDERVAFDVGECTGELRPTRFFTAIMSEGARDVEGLGYSAVDTPLDAFSEAVGGYLAERGVSMRGGVVLTTSGTSTSLAILARALASAGEIVAVEHPTWHVALAAFASARLRVLGIPVDDEGLRVDLLEAALRKHRVRFIYAQPAFQNPTGVSLSAARRAELLALARAFDTPIVEDDFAAELAYEEMPPPLRTEEGGDLVVYLKSFSKLLTPSLRLAAMVAPHAYAAALRSAQHGLDPFPSTLAQSVVARCLSAPELLVDAARLGVGFSPGPAFCLDGAGQRGARLAFGATPPLMIERGVRHLAQAIRERLREPGRTEPTFRAC